MAGDSLKLLPVGKWEELEEVFMKHWPRSIAGILTLEAQKKLIMKGMNSSFQVYCPFGDVRNGIVAFNSKDAQVEYLILHYNNDTTELDKSLRQTALIHWTLPFEVPFAPIKVAECVKSIIKDKKGKIDYAAINDIFVLDKNTALFEDIGLAPEFCFQLLSLENVEMINAKWPHRHANSLRYFEMLIEARQGYGLFKDKKLVAWVFVKEIDVLGHLYTLEKHRRKGYGEAVLKLISNILLKENKYVVAFCIRTNTKAHSLYKKLGYKIIDEVEWLHFNG